MRLRIHHGVPHRRGLTLAEYAAICLLALLLAGPIVPRLLGHAGSSISKPNADLSELHGLLENFWYDCGRFPTTAEGLQALIVCPPSIKARWKGPYIQSIPKDPWGYDYHYKSPGTDKADFDLWSYGADGKPGGEGDDEDIYDGAN